MKRMTTAVAAALACLALGSASANPFSTAKPGVTGILSADGTFRPFLQQSTASTPTVKTVTGTLELKLTISVASSLPSNATIRCALSATVVGVADGTHTDSIEETAEVPATVSGSTATCKPVIPYEWHLFANTSSALSRDSVSLTYSVTATSSSNPDGRTSAVSFTQIAVPANASTTSFSEAGRI